MSLEPSIPFELHCLYCILIKDAVPEKVRDLLLVSDTETHSWEKGRKIYSRDKLGEVENYDNIIISQIINGYVIVICNRFYDLKYSMSCIDLLSKGYHEVYSIVNDEHTGQQRFIKILEGKIVRFFERDADYHTGEFGSLTEEEIQLDKENQEHDFYHVKLITEKLLKISNSDPESIKFFNEEIILGKRRLEKIEKYKQYVEYLSYKDKTNRGNISIDDLPF